MHLSPFIQYYVRKLLRQYIGCFNYPSSGIGVCAYFQTNLEHLLKQIYPKSFELKTKIQELETLVQLHQLSEPGKLSPYGDTSEIESKIFAILGLKLLRLLSSLSLPIVPETSTSLFHFVLEEQIHQGIRYTDELYGLVLQFDREPDLQSHYLLRKLVDQQISFILTASEFRHGIWVSLRSPSYYSFCQQKHRVLEKIA